MSLCLELVRNLAALLLTAAFLELLLPKGSTGDLVRLVLSVLLLLTLLSPVLSLLKPGALDAFAALDRWEQAFSRDGTEYARQGEALARELTARGEADWRQETQAALEEWLLTQPGVAAARVRLEWDEQGQPVAATLSLEGGDWASCRRGAAQRLGLAEDRVTGGVR